MVSSVYVFFFGFNTFGLGKIPTYISIFIFFILFSFPLDHSALGWVSGGVVVLVSMY